MKRGRILGAVLLAALPIALAALPLAAPAAAHTDLASSTPVDGAYLSVAPSRVVLEFESALLPETVNVSILDSQGALVTEVDPDVADATVSIAWPASLPAGDYSLAYRVVSGDGHPVTGEIGFRYASSSSASPSAASARATPSASASASATLGTPAVASPPPAAPDDQNGTPAMPNLVIGGVLLLGALVVSGIFAARARRS
ncbi:unannotated protein [freshwater metagenome]|uniref:Unannotated protein n=1 Tax=freshwater metagenome TaxID=449393 RepID=A0A6J7EAY2_9ZZZZ